METEKHNRTNNSSTSELFVCFTSRLSSSSMKLSSKSILSPSRSRDQPQISLSSSLSRRLKSNGSMKGGQASPMFPTSGGKKRGCGFENPEPSSPKVTCIGQVRVKTKKQGKKMRSRSKRRGEASFRRGEQMTNNPDLVRQNSQSFQYQNHQNLQQECLKHRNQRWVHLPLTICEALREFSCFFPCRSSCMSNEREKEEKGNENRLERTNGERSSVGNSREGSCGAAFARWLVAYQDGDGKGRGIELMMENEEMEMEMMEEDVDVDGREKSERSYSQRRHIFEDLDIDLVDEKITQEEFGGEVEEEVKGRVSICVPPKNALLLMRCRSDPVKMAALANRFWESPLHKEQQQDKDLEHHQIVDEEQVEDSGDEDEEKVVEEKVVEEKEEGFNDQNIEMEQAEEPQQQLLEVETMSHDVNICESETQDFVENYEIGSKINIEVDEEITKEEEEKDEDGNGVDDDKDEIFTCVLLDSLHADLEKPETEETHHGEDLKVEEIDERLELSSSPEIFVAISKQENDEAEVELETVEKVSTEEEEEKEQEHAPTQQVSDPEMSLIGSTKRDNGSKQERERETLPECLLLMMCEPKLSMEVSKETWVCSTDFIRWLPERPAGKVAGVEKRVTVESSSSLCTKPKVKVKPAKPIMQPPRSSCSFPVTGGGTGMSMATMIEQKLVGCSKSRNGYEPFVLTRCKSEPMRSATKLAAPEACFWNNRKLEPHPQSASLGVGAPAGVGF